MLHRESTAIRHTRLSLLTPRIITHTRRDEAAAEWDVECATILLQKLEKRLDNTCLARLHKRGKVHPRVLAISHEELLEDLKSCEVLEWIDHYFIFLNIPEVGLREDCKLGTYDSALNVLDELVDFNLLEIRGLLVLLLACFYPRCGANRGEKVCGENFEVLHFQIVNIELYTNLSRSDWVQFLRAVKN